MGTYGLSKQELCIAMAEALDDLEGNFSDQGLHDALNKMKDYPYTSNSRKTDKKWRKFLND